MEKRSFQREKSIEQATRQIVLGLVAVFKKLNLYPDSHTVYQNAIVILKNLFDDYFKRFGHFRMRLERSNIFYHDTMLYKGTDEPMDLAFVLHRDGIQWIEFQTGLQLWEISAFLKILKDFSVLEDDPADDIVTALWSAGLPSIQYEAADLELGLQSDINIAELKAAEDQVADIKENHDGQDQTGTSSVGFASTALLQDGQSELWEITDVEREQLRNMIVAEEALDGSDYAIDALLYILERHCLEEDVAELLDTLMQELRNALINHRFNYLLEVMIRLKKGALKDHAKTKWLAPYLNRFFTDLGTAAFLNGLLEIQTTRQRLLDVQLKTAKRFLLQLDPSAITALGSIMINIKSPELQRVVMEVIGTMSMSDFQPLEDLISKADSILAGRLVFILGFLKDLRSRQKLSSLLKHRSELVRQPALKAVIARDDQSVDEIFALVDDPDKNIRMLILNHLGRQRSTRFEIKLLDYLKTLDTSKRNSEHFIAVCSALGRCGSERSESYLTELLFKMPQMGILRSANSIKRQGAIVALKGLNTGKAAWLLERSNRGLLGNILRSANSYAS